MEASNLFWERLSRLLGSPGLITVGAGGIGAFMRTRRAEWGPGDEASASSSFDEAAPSAAASGLVARMAVQRSGAGHALNRSWSASDRAGPSPLSEASGPSGAHSFLALLRAQSPSLIRPTKGVSPSVPDSRMAHCAL